MRDVLPGVFLLFLRAFLFSFVHLGQLFTVSFPPSAIVLKTFESTVENYK